MAHEITPPSTAGQSQIFFTNDAQTLLEVICPSNPLPVTGTIVVTPSGTQNENLIQIGGTTVLTGSGATGAGSQRITVAVDSATVAGSASLPAGTNVIGHVISDSVTPVKSSTFTATQVTVPATSNGILILVTNASRLGATVSNPGPLTVYVQQAATGVTTSNGFGIPPGSSYNIDSPLYVGALYGIVTSGTQLVTVAELS